MNKDKPDIRHHEWGVSMVLTPNNCPQEVVIGCVHTPYVFSSVHYHKYKKNRIICNTGKLVVDFFPFDVSEDDLERGEIYHSTYDTVVLNPGEDIECEEGIIHRICGLEKLTFITEIYTLADFPSLEDYPRESDIIRVIPAGQKWTIPTTRQDACYV